MSNDLKEIKELIVFQEDAIRERGEQSWDIFVTHRDAFVGGTQRCLGDDEQNLPSNAALIVARFLMTSSFIAAHFGLEGDKSNRDSAAQSCATIIWSLGCDPMRVMERHIHYEDLWKRCLIQHGLAPRASESGAGCAIIILFVIVSAGFFASWWVS